MRELAENITSFFAMIAVSSICIGVTTFIWHVIYKEWRSRR